MKVSTNTMVRGRSIKTIDQTIKIDVFSWFINKHDPL